MVRLARFVDRSTCTTIFDDVSIFAGVVVDRCVSAVFLTVTERSPYVHEFPWKLPPTVWRCMLINPGISDDCVRINLFCDYPEDACPLRTFLTGCNTSAGLIFSNIFHYSDRIDVLEISIGMPLLRLIGIIIRLVGIIAVSRLFPATTVQYISSSGSRAAEAAVMQSYGILPRWKLKVPPS